MTSPFVRMFAVFVVGYLARIGLITAEDVTQSVNDAIIVIEFLSVVVALLIWQWKAHHPGKIEIDATLPDVPEQQIVKSRLAFKEVLNRVVDKLVVRNPQQ